MSFANNIGVIILAAGTSSRLGEPKQLLQYHKKSLLQHAMDAAIKSNADQVIVVLGANADQVSREIDRSNAHILINTEWEEGMSSSIRNGLNELLFISPSIDAVLIMVCDQPHVTADLINELINTQRQTGKMIVTCNYGETIGPPALFHKSIFPELTRLKGDTGARNIIQQHMHEVASVPFAKGKIDIDTKEDYDLLHNS